MKAEATAQRASRPVVVWEKRGEQPAESNVILFPHSRDGKVQAEQEATVTRREVGSANHPAVVTEVSSGFSRKSTSVSSPQAMHMRMAA